MLIQALGAAWALNPVSRALKGGIVPLEIDSQTIWGVFYRRW